MKDDKQINLQTPYEIKSPTCTRKHLNINITDTGKGNYRRWQATGGQRGQRANSAGRFRHGSPHKERLATLYAICLQISCPAIPLSLLRLHIQCVLIGEDHHARLCSGWLFHVPHSTIIHRHLCRIPCLAVICRQLCRLFSGARSTGHDLLLEIIVDQPQTREEQDACLLRWMRRCYELGVYPDYWKILPVADQGTWQAIEALIGEYDPYCRGILFLGLNVAESELVKRFAALPESPRALGFAIGRSIFLEPARKWFAGQMSDEDAVATMRDCFLRLARAWNGRNRG